MGDPRGVGSDPLAHCLEWGLLLVVVILPLPIGSVGPVGRLLLEVGALALGLIWIVRSTVLSAELPSRLTQAAIVGLVLLAALQLLPLGAPTLSLLSPHVVEIHQLARPTPSVLAAEQNLIGVDPTSLDAIPTLSLDPSSTASALRTGLAFGMLLLVATTVAATRGVRRLALALLLSASFQGLYGILVLASGHDKIWHLPKQHYLTAATGTFVNKNHFACYLAMSLACGLALVLQGYGRDRMPATRRRLVRLFGGENSRSIFLAVFLVVGAAGLFASLSRAGIFLGLLALLLTTLALRRGGSLRTRIILALLILAVALVPLLQIGSDQLVARYARSTEDLTATGGRATVWADTFRMAAAFPLTGSGFGTFASVYPLFRSPDVRFFYKHAHNDPLQALAEGGVVGLLFVVLLLTAVVRSIIHGLSGALGPLGVGLAAGLTAFLLHSLVDFNLHMPANAATAAVLAGALQGLPWVTRN